MTSTGNTIRHNSIYSNSGLGIDLGNDGVTLNDTGDVDTGPNNLQNYPLLASVDAGASTRVEGSLNSTANTQFVIEVFANSNVDASGHGEGERFLGSFAVTTDGAGNAAFDVTLASATKGGEFVSTTVTDPAGNTSEFSGGFVQAILPIEIDISPGDDVSTTNVSKDGVISVAILTTDSFAASTVNASTVVFAGAFSVHSALEDVDNDGDLDLILQFRVEDTILSEIYEDLIAADDEQSARQSTEISLTGETNDGELFEGADAVDLLLTGKNLRELLDELALLGLI